MFKRLSVVFALILVLVAGVSAGTFFKDDFTTFSGWDYLPDNCSGFTLNSDGDNLYVESYGDCSALQWEGVVQELPEYILDHNNCTVSMDLEVTSDPEGQIGGIQIELLDHEDNVVGYLRWLDPQVSSGYGGISAYIDGQKIMGDESGLDDSHPTINGTLALKNNGKYWSVWLDDQILAGFVYAPGFAFNKISISFYNFGTVEYEHRDIKLDRVRILFPLKIYVNYDYEYLNGTIKNVLERLFSGYYAEVTLDGGSLSSILGGNYDLVWIMTPDCIILQDQDQVAVSEYVLEGGNLMLEGGVPYRLAVNSSDFSLIPWIGASSDGVSGDSIRVSVNNPFGTTLTAGTELHVPVVDPAYPCISYGLTDPTTGEVISNFHGACGNEIHMLKNTYNSAKILYLNTRLCDNRAGDVDGSGGQFGHNMDTDISDIVFLIRHLYIDHPPLGDPLEADVNSSGGEPDISDIVRLIDYLYLSKRPLDCKLGSSIFEWPEDLELLKAGIHWMLEDRLPDE